MQPHRELTLTHLPLVWRYLPYALMIFLWACNQRCQNAEAGVIMEFAAV